MLLGLETGNPEFQYKYVAFQFPIQHHLEMYNRLLQFTKGHGARDSDSEDISALGVTTPVGFA